MKILINGYIFIILISISYQFEDEIICSLPKNKSCKPTFLDFFRLSSHPVTDVIHLSFDEKSNGSKRIFTFCYPDKNLLSSSNKSNNFYLLSHVLCRHLGFTTFVSIGSINVMKGDRDLILPTVICDGTEQHLEDCEWPEVRKSDCKQYLELKCGSCSQYLTDVDGDITSPAYPKSFIPLIQCDWLIETELGNSIELHISEFNFPFGKKKYSDELGDCSVDEPFLEIEPLENSNTELEGWLKNKPNRFCGRRRPQDRIRADSKFMRLYYSGGILELYEDKKHNPFGFKIHYNTISGRNDDNVDQKYLIYTLISLAAIVVFLIVVLLITLLCRCRVHKKNNRSVNLKKALECKKCGVINLSQRNLYEDITSGNNPTPPPIPERNEETIQRTEDTQLKQRRMTFKNAKNSRARDSNDLSIRTNQFNRSTDFQIVKNGNFSKRSNFIEKKKASLRSYTQVVDYNQFQYIPPNKINGRETSLREMKLKEETKINVLPVTSSDSSSADYSETPMKKISVIGPIVRDMERSRRSRRRILKAQNSLRKMAPEKFVKESIESCFKNGSSALGSSEPGTICCNMSPEVINYIKSAPKDFLSNPSTENEITKILPWT